MLCCWGGSLVSLGVAASSARGPAIPSLGNPARVRNRRPTCGTGGPRAGWPVDVRNRQTACRRRWPYTRLAASCANPLCGAWAFSSARGPAIPSLGNPAHMRNRRPACGTGGPRVGWPVAVRNRQAACRRRWPYTRLAASRANPLCGAWAFSSARGPAIPSLGNPAHMRNRRPACGTGGPRAGCEGARVVVACGQSVTDRGAAAHARDAVCA